uniref:Uncharacterized protein n=1 Tax=Apteryx owenii TaxID=8824 RepID=A0A8B9QGN4_APTOW
AEHWRSVPPEPRKRLQTEIQDPDFGSTGQGGYFLPLHIPKQSITLCEKKAQALQSLSLWLTQEISPIISANPPPIQ